MKKVIGIILFSVLCHYSYAQQQGQFSQYMLNNYLINPAAAGAEDEIDIKSSFRGQWVGVDGAPVNYYLSAQSVIGKVPPEGAPRPKRAAGFMFTGQELGVFKRNGFYGSYAYHMPVSRSTYLSVGVSAGILNLQLNTNRIVFSDDNPDMAVQNVNNQYKFDANAGVYLYNKKVFIGASTMQLFKNRLDFSDTASGHGFLNRHIHVLAGYTFTINEDLVLIPSVLVKSVGHASNQIDINGRLIYKERYWGGISYRKTDAIVLLAGLRITDIFEVGYSYDITTSALSVRSRGSHEILIGARFKKKTVTVLPGDYW